MSDETLDSTRVTLEAAGLEHFFLGTREAELGVRLRARGFAGELKLFVVYPWREEGAVYYAAPVRVQVEGEAELEPRFSLEGLAVYRPDRQACLLPQGRYWILAGENWEGAICAGSLFLPQEIVTLRGEHPEKGGEECRSEDFAPLSGLGEGAGGKPEIILNPFDLPAAQE